MRQSAWPTMATTAPAMPRNTPATSGTSPLAAASQDSASMSTTEGSRKNRPESAPPRQPNSRQPRYTANWCASGPGRSMQKPSARWNTRSSTQPRACTRSLCIMAICPAGPPKLMNPSLSQ